MRQSHIVSTHRKTELSVWKVATSANFIREDLALLVFSWSSMECREASLMRCLYDCRSIKPHVLSCWEMNYSFFSSDFCLDCNLSHSSFCRWMAMAWLKQQASLYQQTSSSQAPFITHSIRDLTILKKQNNFQHSHFLIDWHSEKIEKKTSKN